MPIKFLPSLFFSLLFFCNYVFIISVAVNPGDYVFVDPKNAKIKVKDLRALLDQRGMPYHDFNEKSEYVNALIESGPLTVGELKIARDPRSASISSDDIKELVTDSLSKKFFKTAFSNSEIWLVRIDPAINPMTNILEEAVWHRLKSALSTFEVQFGRYNCEDAAEYCEEKGWNSPTLILIVPQLYNSAQPSAKAVADLLQTNKNSDDQWVYEVDSVVKQIYSQVHGELVRYLPSREDFDNFQADKLKCAVHMVLLTDLRHCPFLLSALAAKFNHGSHCFAFGPKMIASGSVPLPYNHVGAFYAIKSQHYYSNRWRIIPRNQSKPDANDDTSNAMVTFDSLSDLLMQLSLMKAEKPKTPKREPVKKETPKREQPKRETPKNKPLEKESPKKESPKKEQPKKEPPKEAKKPPPAYTSRRESFVSIAAIAVDPGDYVYVDPKNATIKVKDLRALLDRRGLGYHGFQEKSEYVNALIESGPLTVGELKLARDSIGKSMSSDDMEELVTDLISVTFMEIFSESSEIWLVRIDPAINSMTNTLDEAVWQRLITMLSTFEVEFGRFNCKTVPNYCQTKGWNSPTLILIIPQLYSNAEHSPKAEAHLLQPSRNSLNQLKYEVDSVVKQVYSLVHEKLVRYLPSREAFDSLRTDRVTCSVHVVLLTDLRNCPFLLSALAAKFYYGSHCFAFGPKTIASGALVLPDNYVGAFFAIKSHKYYEKRWRIIPQNQSTADAKDATSNVMVTFESLSGLLKQLSPIETEKPKPPQKEPPIKESPKTEPSKSESPKKEPPKKEPPKKEPPKKEPPKTEPSKKESPKKQPPKKEPPKTEPPKKESTKEAKKPSSPNYTSRKGQSGYTTDVIELFVFIAL
uniref:Uncharacterized protein n=1 Tax=Plectus sambesii TaxID=2011161 RepID=A0A914V6M7_9BILA